MELIIFNCIAITCERIRKVLFHFDRNKNYPKYVVSMDPIAASKDGVVHLRLVDFLLDESLLRLG